MCGHSSEIFKVYQAANCVFFRISAVKSCTHQQFIVTQRRSPLTISRFSKLGQLGDIFCFRICCENVPRGPCPIQLSDNKEEGGVGGPLCTSQDFTPTAIFAFVLLAYISLFGRHLVGSENKKCYYR